MRDTSLQAYYSILDEISDKQSRVHSMLELRKKTFPSDPGMTDKELSVKLGLPINTITPRRNELVALGLVKDLGVRKCAETGRNAHIWTTCSPEEFTIPKKESLTDVEMKHISEKLRFATVRQLQKICEESSDEITKKLIEV